MQFCYTAESSAAEIGEYKYALSKRKRPSPEALCHFGEVSSDNEED